MSETADAKNKTSYIFGRSMRGQARLLRSARHEGNKWRKISLDEHHYRFLRDFFQKNYGLLAGLLALLLSQGLIESLLVILSRNQLSGPARAWLSGHTVWFFSGLIAVFLLNSFVSLKYERSLLVILANALRRRIFKSYVNRSIEESSSERQADLVAKISYHLPLVSMGVSNAFFGIWRWLVYGAIIAVLASLADFNILLVLGVFISVSTVLFIAAYWASRFYISQEVTFYSRIIKEVDFNASNISFVKNFAQERFLLEKFDKLVWFDSFFRVRRDILLRIGFKVVFALLTVISLFIHFYPSGFFSFIGTVTAGERFIFLFLLVYFSRSLNEAAKIGLYLFPARLGLFLTILKPGAALSKDASFRIGAEKMIFSSYKTKLFPESPYFRNLRLSFSPGDRILFQGENLSGKSSLAKLLAGREAYNPRAVKVCIGARRLEYIAWQKMCASAYFIDPNFRSDRTLMECLAGRMKENTGMDEQERILQAINRYPDLVSLVASDGNYNREAAAVLANPLRAFALHALHCLAADYRLIVVDNFWLDLGYDGIRAMLTQLDKAMPDSVIVVFSRECNNCLSYTHQYEIAEKIKLADCRRK